MLIPPPAVMPAHAERIAKILAEAVIIELLRGAMIEATWRRWEKEGENR